MIKILFLFMMINLVSAYGTPQCLNPFKELFKKEWETKHDRFIIHTIPKCGVHQLQRLIHLLVPEDIQYDGIDSIATQFYYERKIVYRSHDFFSNTALNLVKDHNYKMIAIIRDPRDALISHVHYMRLFGIYPNIGKQRDIFFVRADFDSLTFDQQVKLLIEGDKDTWSYIWFYKAELGWSLSGYPLVVKYEDLLGSQGELSDKIKQHTIKKIARYIGLSLSQDSLQFVFDNLYDNQVPYAFVKPPLDGNDIMDGKIYKRASAGQWKNFLNEENKRLLKDAIGQELIQLGYEKDLDW